MMEDQNTNPSSPVRLDALEMRVAHQDRALDDLNGVITAQWTVIEELRRQVAALGNRLAEAEDRSAMPTPTQRPPHY